MKSTIIGINGILLFSALMLGCAKPAEDKPASVPEPTPLASTAANETAVVATKEEESIINCDGMDRTWTLINDFQCADPGSADCHHHYRVKDTIVIKVADGKYTYISDHKQDTTIKDPAKKKQSTPDYKTDGTLTCEGDHVLKGKLKVKHENEIEIHHLLIHRDKANASRITVCTSEAENKSTKCTDKIHSGIGHGTDG